MTQMLPLLMMRHRRIPRAKWKDCVTINGKHWIEQVGGDFHELLTTSNDHRLEEPGRHATRKISAFNDWIPPGI